MAGEGGGKSRRSLRGREAEAVVLLADGLSNPEAAKWLNVGLRTVERFAALPETRRAVKELRDRRAADLVGGLTTAGSEAVGVLRQLMTSAPPGVRLGAARSVLEFLLKGRELVELAGRVAELEAGADERPGAGDSAGEAGGGPAGGPGGGPDAGGGAGGPGERVPAGEDAGRPVAGGTAEDSAATDARPLFPSVG